MVPTDHLHPDAGPVDIPQSRARAPVACAECERIYEARFRQNWTLVQSMIDYCSGDETRRWIKTEYATGSDLYHGIGSARTAAVWGILLAFLYDLVYRGIFLGQSTWLVDLPDSWWRPAALAALFAGLGIGQYLVLSMSRETLVQNYENRIASALAFVSKDLDPRGAPD